MRPRKLALAARNFHQQVIGVDVLIQAPSIAAVLVV
jgi:hypothetical protein